MVRKRTKKLLKKLKASATAAKHAGKHLGSNSTVRDGVRVKFPQKPRPSKTKNKTKTKGDSTENRKRKRRLSDAGAEESAQKSAKQEEDGADDDAPTMTMDEFLAGGFKKLMGDEAEDKKALTQEEEEEDDDDEEKQEDDVEDDDDDEDEDEDEDEEADHQRDLDKLKETDPEFHAHLVANASELLQFQSTSTSTSTAKEEKTIQKEITSESAKADDDTDQEKLLTSAKLSKLTKLGFEQKSSKAVKELLQGFKAGCHMGDDKSGALAKKSRMKFKYMVVSPTVFQKLVITVLRKLHPWLHHKLHLAKLKDGQLPSKSKRFGVYERLIKSFLRSYLHLLDSSTDPTMLQFLLQSARHYGKYFACFPAPMAKVYLKYLLKLWGSSEHEVVRILAFLRIRQLAIEAKSSFLDKTIKASYLTFVRNAKFSNNELVAGRIAMQAKCFVELCGVDLVVTYQNGFTYIRQLALHLRTALLSKTEESVQQVYSWQFLHCIKLWAAVLCAHAGEQQLRPLLYPFIQVVMGTIGLVPGPRHIPIRLHLARVLNAVSRASNLYIPTASVILDVFTSTSELLLTKPTPSTKKPPNMEYTLRFRKQEIRTNACQSAVVKGCIEALRDHFECYRFSVSFPEIIHPSIMVLKSFARKTRVSPWRSQVQALVKQLFEWKQTILKKRERATFGPTNVTRLEAFSSAIEREEQAKKPVEVFNSHPSPAEPTTTTNPTPQGKKKKEKTKLREGSTITVDQIQKDAKTSKGEPSTAEQSGSEDIVQELELSSEDEKDEDKDEEEDGDESEESV